jgi:Tfp pilus assembly protein FimT
MERTRVSLISILVFMLTHFKKRKSKLKNAGFTVVELLVTIAIVVLVTGLIMIQYSAFNNSVLLKNQAYLTAFDIREAQTLAVSVKGQGGQFREEYGIHFTVDGQSPDSYILFQDNDSNGEYYPVRYDAGEEVGTPYMVDPRFVIVNLCATNGSGRTCYADDPATSNETVDATLRSITTSFRRPNFDAAFYSPSKSNITSIEIKLGTPNGDIERTVLVYQTGQISVE